MKLPRRIIPGTTYFITRRCTRRQFLLKPSKMVNQIFAYCLAWASATTNVRVHAFVVMSNHWHAVVTDTNGRLPEFTELLHKFVAKCINTLLGRWENLWSTEKCSYVELGGAEDILNKIVYVICNPVISGLVGTYRQWPGLVSLPEDYLNPPEEIKRVSIFFREDGTAPKVVNLELSIPPAFEEIGAEEFARLVESRCAKREQEVKEKMKVEGRKPLGVKRILKQKPTDSPATESPHRNLNPRVASVNKWRRLEAARRIKSFIKLYREAWEKFKAGMRDVLFPEGTYWMRRFAGVAWGSG